MMRWLALALVVIGAGQLPAQGKLEQARQETVSSSRSSRDDDRRNADDDSSCGEGWLARSSSCTDEEDHSFGSTLGLALTSPLWGPLFLLKGNGGTGTPGYFPGYPYAVSDTGFMHIGPIEGTPPRRRSDAQQLMPWSARFAIEHGFDFDGLMRSGTRFRIDTTSRFGLITNWDSYRENLPGLPSDELVLGDLTLTYRFAQSESIQMYTGVGARGLFSSTRTRGGFNFVYGAELYPVWPWALAASAEFGTLGDARTTRLRGTVGVQVLQCELYVGYDWTRIGTVDLGAPMFGVRLSF